MSDVNAHDTQLIEDPHETLWALYQGAGTGNSKIGIEVELAFFNQCCPELRSIDVAQNENLIKKALELFPGDWLRKEPTAEIIEIGGIAVHPKEIRIALDDIKHKSQVIDRTASSLNLRRSYFQDLPDKTGDELLQNVVDIERFKAFWGPYRPDMKGEAVYFAVCKSNQVSVSYRNPHHLFENVRRLYALAPFLFLLTENTTGFDERQPFTGCAGMHHRTALGGRGGVPPYLFTSQNGEDYLRAHINYVMNNPLFVYYNEKGEIIRLPTGTWTSFNELKGHGLNTATNYWFAQSILWPDVKMAAIRDEAGTVTGHRYEARMFGVGGHQHYTALLISKALAFDQDFASQIDELLARAGFDFSDEKTARSNLEKAYKFARNHDDQFFDILYGTTTMRDFARNFGKALENCYAGSEFEPDIAPAIHICATGCTDTKVNRKAFPTLEDVIAHQKNYDQSFFNGPARCAADIVGDDICRREDEAA